MTHDCEVVFPPIDAAVAVTFSDSMVKEIVERRFSTPGGVVAALNMDIGPSGGSKRVVGAVHIESEKTGSGFAVSFSGSVSTRKYVAGSDEIVADAYTVVLAALQTGLLDSSTIAFHAAFLDIHGAGVLLAGPSGAGKTSTSVAALDAGYTVFSGELTFISEGCVILGESSLAIGAGALAKFGLDIPVDAEGRGANWVVPLPVLPSRRRIDIVVFPRVGVGPPDVQRVPRKSAEVQAFECATSQASIWRIVGNRTEHVSVPWKPSFSEKTIAQAFRVCNQPTWFIQGTPQSVVRSIAQVVAGARN